MVDSSQAVSARALEIWNGVVDNDVRGLSVSQLDKVEKIALSLDSMSDEALLDSCKSAVYSSALVSRFRGFWEDHAICTLHYNESCRRDPDTGPEHRGASIYARAHHAVMKEHGYA